MTCESPSASGKQLTRRRPPLRRALYRLAVVAVRFGAALKTRGDALLAVGKSK